MNNTLAPLSDRLIAGASYGGLSLIGLTFNISLLVVLVRNRSTFSSSVFYVFVWQLMLGDMTILISQIVVAMPLSLSGRALLGEGFLRLALSSFDTVGFYIISLTTFILSLNRLTVFVAPRINDILFKKPVVYTIFAIPWTYAAFWTVYTSLMGCPKTFSHEAYYFSFNCSTNISQLDRQIYDFVATACFCGPVVSLVFYMITFVAIRLKVGRRAEDERTAAQQRKRERSFLTQVSLYFKTFHF